MLNNSTKQKGKKNSTSHYRSKFPAYGDKLPKKVGKPWRGKGGAHFMQAWWQKDLPTLYQSYHNQDLREIHKVGRILKLN